MDEQVQRSKRLAYHLRHDPGAIGLELDAGGWASVERLLAALADAGRPMTREQLEEVVARSTRQRFELSDDGTRIRARYGHSVPVETQDPVRRPPAELFHGTPQRSVDRILVEGLRPMGRRKVHLSADVETAIEVAGRRGRPAVLVVDAARLHQEGARFTAPTRDVWLVDHVPAHHLRRYQAGRSDGDGASGAAAPGSPSARRRK